MKNAFFVSTLLISGCTTLGIPVSNFEASRYTTIESFIAGNFTIGPELFYSKDMKRLEEEGVFWTARFNEMNHTYLDKPSKDLVTYCESQEGKLANIPRHDLKLAAKGSDTIPKI